MRESELVAGRMAKCYYCHSTVPSNPKLVFFEYRGPGSNSYELTCAICGFWHIEWVNRNHDFLPGYDKGDSYYCGCRGWD